MGRSLDLNVIVSQPLAHRDSTWEQTFYQALIDGRIKLESEMPKAGPDGWPYMYVRTDPSATEPAARLIQWLATKGIGMVVNAHKQVPDFVFTYGMLWNFKERQEFITVRKNVPNGVVEFKSGEELLVGEPSEHYLPGYVRNVLVEFFKDQGVEGPRVLMISKDGQHYDLCISLESIGKPEKGEHKNISEAIGWFLPQHYSIVLISEKGLPQFLPLIKA